MQSISLDKQMTKNKWSFDNLKLLQHIFSDALCCSYLSHNPSSAVYSSPAVLLERSVRKQRRCNKKMQLISGLLWISGFAFYSYRPLLQAQLDNITYVRIYLSSVCAKVCRRWPFCPQGLRQNEMKLWVDFPSFQKDKLLWFSLFFLMLAIRTLDFKGLILHPYLDL